MGQTQPLRRHGDPGRHRPNSWMQDGRDNPRQLAPGLAAPHRNGRRPGLLMIAPSPEPRLTDIVDAIGNIRSDLQDATLESFAANRQKRWLVERGLEIISEASRHLPEDM